MKQQTGDRAFESSFSQLGHCSFVNVEECSTTGVRNLLKACSKNPSGPPGSVFTIAIIRLPRQLIQQIDCSLQSLSLLVSHRVNAGALGSSRRRQRAWSSSQHPLGEWESYQPFLSVEGHSAVQSYQLHLKCPSFCDHHSPFPDCRSAECFPVPWVSKNNPRSCMCFWLGVCSPWQPALSDRAIQVSTSQ